MTEFKIENKIALSPTEWLEEVAKVMKEYGFVGETSIPIIKWSDVYEYEEYVEESLLGV